MRLLQICSFAAVISMCTVQAFAQDEKRDRGVDDTRLTNAGSLDTKTTGATIRASQLIGTNIQNSQGESVGEIHDLVLDGSTGKVRYAAVTYGGFLGIGNKLFAVPFTAFKVRMDPDDRDDHILVLNVTQKQLEGAVGFDEDHWPNFADKKFTAEIDRRYGVDRNKDVDVRVHRGGVDVDVKSKPNSDR